MDFFLLKERGLLCTRLPDVVVYHYPALPPEYHTFRANSAPDVRLVNETRGLSEQVTVDGSSGRPTASSTACPGTVAATGRRAVRGPGRLLREGRLRAKSLR